MKSVFIAGPFSNNPSYWTGRAIKEADRLVQEGFLPFVPHLCITWDLVIPHTYDFWLNYTLMWVERCDCVLRMPGASRGAELEVAKARRLGKPVYFCVGDLVAGEI